MGGEGLSSRKIGRTVGPKIYCIHRFPPDSCLFRVDLKVWVERGEMRRRIKSALRRFAVSGPSQLEAYFVPCPDKVHQCIKMKFVHQKSHSLCYR